jgi:hypothetical protein
MHLLFSTTHDRFVDNARHLAEEQGIWLWPEPMATDDPEVVRCELSVGRATCRLPAEDVVTALRSLCR